MRLLIEVIDAKGETVSRLGFSAARDAAEAEINVMIQHRLAGTVFHVGDVIKIREVK